MFSSYMIGIRYGVDFSNDSEIPLLKFCQILNVIVVRLFPFSQIRQRAHGECNRSEEDTHSLMMILPLVFVEVRVYSTTVLYFSFGL